MEERGMTPRMRGGQGAVVGAPGKRTILQETLQINITNTK